MAGPGDEISPAAGGRGHLRASHADRDRVVATLKAAFVQGMLSKDEFDQRVGQTLSSRTYADLAALTADLPPGLVPARSPQPSRATGGQSVVRPSRVLQAATALYAGGWAYALFLSPNGGDNAWAPALLFQGFVVYLGILIVCMGAIAVSRQEKGSGEQPPRPPGGGGAGSRGLPPAGPGGQQFPPADPGQRHTAEAVRTRRPRPPLPVRGCCAGGAPGLAG
jgi:Domain of unknown function (DUF1707)